MAPGADERLDLSPEERRGAIHPELPEETRYWR